MHQSSGTIVRKTYLPHTGNFFLRLAYATISSLCNNLLIFMWEIFLRIAYKTIFSLYMQQFVNFHIRSFLGLMYHYFFRRGGEGVGGRDGDTFKTSFPLRTTFAFTNPQCKDVFRKDSFRPYHNTKILLPIKSISRLYKMGFLYHPTLYKVL